MAAFARRAQQRSQHPRTVWVWPRHLPALRLYIDSQTQWREGFSGATGLDYAGVEALLRLQGVRGAQRAERFAELQVMERAALQGWARRREERKRR
jgi:hypothetical protein